MGEGERGLYKVLYGEAPLRGPTPYTFVKPFVYLYLKKVPRPSHALITGPYFE